MALNNAVEIRREILARLSKLIITDQLVEKIDRLPIEMRPKDKENTRCCVHKERAVLKYKTMAVLGFNVYDEKDELDPLSHYAKLAQERTDKTSVMMTVVDEACSSCVKNNYIVTNLCRACVARPCTYACKKGAISKDEHGIEHIDPDKCIYCGKCMVACPFGAIFEKTFLIDIFRDIKEGKKVVAMVAPSLGGQFKADYGKVLAGIKKLGFFDVVEVALGANITTEHEREEFIERLHEGASFMTTSCCPSWMNLVRKHLPEMQQYVSTTHSPMVYTARHVREKYPDAKTVMVSPCVGKRSESCLYDEVDYVISYEEIEALFKASNIDLEALEPMPLDPNIVGHGRGFAMISGVTESVKLTAPDPNVIKEVVIDGLNKQVIRQLKQYAKAGQCPGNFIEVMSCPGGCVNGCDTINNPKTAARQILPTTK